MNRIWTLSLVVAAALGLQACEQEPPRTTVTPPQSSLPDDATLNTAPGSGTAQAPAVTAPAPVDTAAAPPAVTAPDGAAAPPPATGPDAGAVPPTDAGVAAPAGASTAQTQPTTSGDNPVPPQASSDPGAAGTPASPATGSMGAAAPMGAAATVPDGTAAPTELGRFFEDTSGKSSAAPSTPSATNPPAAPVPSNTSAPQGQASQKVSALPAVRNPGDVQGAQLLAQRSLLVPVAGIAPASLTDQYDQARGGRRHEAIDLLAPSGTPVVAVDDGRIAKLFNSKAGGLTIYQFDRASQLAYYYAHLQRYADGVREGMDVRRGDVIGYVGITGNADARTPHLHFAVFRLGNPPRWWEGEPVNPWPALSRAEPADQVAVR